VFITGNHVSLLTSANPGGTENRVFWPYAFSRRLQPEYPISQHELSEIQQHHRYR
jgi:hypothetical protein